MKRVDPLLNRLRTDLERAGVWQSTYLILGSDHGMGQTTDSSHPPSTLSSWRGFLAFYGPGIKRGAKIAYAESPDVAVMANSFLGLPPLKGYLEEKVPRYLRGPTGTLLRHVFEGGPDTIEHPRLIERYLASGPPASDRYEEYRAGMLRLLTQ